jgi:hypothetical protein
VDMVPDVGGPGAMKLGGAIVSRAVARRGGLASRRRLSRRQYAVALVVGAGEELSIGARGLVRVNQKVSLG